MAGEDEGLDLVDGGRAEGGVHPRAGFGGLGWGLDFFLVGLEGEVDDGAFAVGAGFGLGVGEGAVAVAVGFGR